MTEEAKFVSKIVSGRSILAFGGGLALFVGTILIVGFMRVGRHNADERVLVTNARIELATLAEKLSTCALRTSLPATKEACETCLPELHGRSDVRFLPTTPFAELEKTAGTVTLRVRVECRGQGDERTCRHGAVMDIDSE